MWRAQLRGMAFLDLEEDLFEVTLGRRGELESGSGRSPLRSRSSIRRRTSAIARAPSRSSPRSSARTPSATWLRSTSRWEAKSSSRSWSGRSASHTTSSTDSKCPASSWARTSSFTSSGSDVGSVRASIPARGGDPPGRGRESRRSALGAPVRRPQRAPSPRGGSPPQPAARCGEALPRRGTRPFPS